MMGPIDPMQYIPTWQLFVIIFLTFGAIYGCGRILEYLLRQFFRCMKYLLLAFIDLLYGDDYEDANNNSAIIEDNNKRRKREAARRIKNEPLNNIPSNSVLLNTSNGTTQRVEVPVETSILEVDVNGNDNESEIAEAMRHSPTDDEEKSKNSSSSVSPAIGHRNNAKHSELVEEPSPAATTVVSASS